MTEVPAVAMVAEVMVGMAGAMVVEVDNKFKPIGCHRD